MKKFLYTMFVTIVTILLPLTVNAACNVVIDGKQLECRDSAGNIVSPFVYEGTTYVPVRSVAEAFNVPISWDMETKTVHLGTPGGNPQLKDEINVYYNGEEYISKDSNGASVFPILKEGTTYLPIRGIGNLFNKSIYWDNLAQTATLTTKPDENTISYLKDTIANTSKVISLKSDVLVEGRLLCNGNLFNSVSHSSVEPYSPVGFTLASFLPADYTKNLSYLGEGKYFIVIPSERFTSNPQLQKTLFDMNTPTSFSSLYMYISTKGGYVTDVTIHFAANLTYKDIMFEELFNVTATMSYPEGFAFPLVPSPGNANEGETAVSPSAGENDDSTLILKIVSSYIDNLTTAKPKAIFSLLHLDDYNNLFSKKSASQINVETTKIQKKLESQYNDYIITYTIDNMIYTSTENLKNEAKATVTLYLESGDESRADEIEIILTKKEDKWYLHLSSAQNLFN